MAVSRGAAVYTIGHSTLAIEDFLAILKAYEIRRLIDIRTVPRSRHNPQFNRDELPKTLKKGGIEYLHMAELGGLRHARKDSINTGWRNASFRGFADYMQTPEFAAGVEHLIELATEKPSAIMCAEAVPWRCHRSLVGDAVTARGMPVFDIFNATKAEPHRMTPFAKVDGIRVTYPAALTE